MYTDTHLKTVADLTVFLSVHTVVGTVRIDLPKQERADWIYDRLLRFDYRRVSKKSRGIILQYLCAITGCSTRQLKRHAKACREGKKLCRSHKRNSFVATFTDTDIRLLAETDDLHATEHGRLNGIAIRGIIQTEYKAGDKRYERLRHISKTHLYRLRATKTYEQRSQHMSKTQSKGSSIGIRKKPEPSGQPGFIRADTVHQGDFNNSKGVYHINLVDEVLQWEVPFAVETLSMQCMAEALYEGLACFPFLLSGFHSDNGSEYINKRVADLLKKLTVEQTKSRPRTSTDNGLVESKNGAIIRKHMGYHHIPQSFATRINQFYQQHLIPYLNFSRPCAFPTVMTDLKGKQKILYREQDYQTPLQRLLSLDNPEQYLKPGVTIEELKKQATEKTPNERMRELKKAKEELKMHIFHYFGTLPTDSDSPLGDLGDIL
jgi:hypothetical protein